MARRPQEWGETTARILNLLATQGPMTRAELQQATGLERMYLSAVVTRLNREGAKTPKRIHIQGYVHDHEGKRKYPRAVYALGNAPDAKKPKSNPREIKRQYLARMKAKHKMNSVFNLGLTNEQVRQIRRSMYDSVT